MLKVSDGNSNGKDTVTIVTALLLLKKKIKLQLTKHEYFLQTLIAGPNSSTAMKVITIIFTLSATSVKV